MKKPTVLILYANYGAGHKRAADAIEEKLSTSFVQDTMNWTIHKTDFLGDAFPNIDKMMRKLYLQSFTWAKPLYKKLYYQTKNLPIDSSVTSLVTQLGSLKLEAYIRSLQADVVICTFPALTGMLAQIKKRGTTDFKLCCVLTDYTTHNHWLYPHVDHYFVPTEEIKQEFVCRGIPAETIQSTGIPVLSQFERIENAATIKEDLQLDAERPVVLISAGAHGVTNLTSICIRLQREYPNIQFVVVCGKNKELYNRLSQVDGLKVVGFTDKMNELLQVADLYITKAGGLSTSEAIATKTPMLLFGSLPGQEMENVNFLTQEKVAQSAESEEELLKVFDAIMADNRSLLHDMTEHINELNKRISHHERWLATVHKACQQEQFALSPSKQANRLIHLYHRFFKREKKSFQI